MTNFCSFQDHLCVSKWDVLLDEMSLCLCGKFLLALASTVIFGSESRGTHDHILLSHDFHESCKSRLVFQSRPVNCCWPSSAQSFLVSDPVGCCSWVGATYGMLALSRLPWKWIDCFSVDYCWLLDTKKQKIHWSRLALSNRPNWVRSFPLLYTCCRKQTRLPKRKF
jgi:hypothetical protein